MSRSSGFEVTLPAPPFRASARDGSIGLSSLVTAAQPPGIYTQFPILLQPWPQALNQDSNHNMWYQIQRTVHHIACRPIFRQEKLQTSSVAVRSSEVVDREPAERYWQFSADQHTKYGAAEHHDQDDESDVGSHFHVNKTYCHCKNRIVCHEKVHREVEGSRNGRWRIAVIPAEAFCADSGT